MEAKAFSFTHRTKVFADDTDRKIHDVTPGGTSRVPEWLLDKGPYKRKRSGKQSARSCRTTE
jgi:hypothetical protein